MTTTTTRARTRRPARRPTSSRAIKFRCPHCEATVRVPSSYARHKGLCPTCGKNLNQTVCQHEGAQGRAD